MNNVETEKNSYDMIIWMKLPVFICLIFISFFGFFVTTNAQVTDDVVNIEMVPKIPKANEVVYVFLTSYATNIDSAQITYKVNGKVIKSGVGEKTFNFTMGDVGKKTTLNVSIKTNDSGTIDKNYSLFPTSVDIIYQSSGYVPPFYKGKALFGHQTKLEIIAIPHIVNESGIEINPKNLIYKWKKNGSVVESASGFGKNIYSLEGSLISKTLNIGVEITSSYDGIFGYANIKLEPKKPSVIVYRKDPIYGIGFQKAIQNDFEFNDSNEIALIGIPFFFESSNYYDYLLYKWSVNGLPIKNENYNNKIQVFRQKEGVTGTSKISLSIENEEKILQYASNDINLIIRNKNN